MLIKAEKMYYVSFSEVAKEGQTSYVANGWDLVITLKDGVKLEDVINTTNVQNVLSKVANDPRELAVRSESSQKFGTIEAKRKKTVQGFFYLTGEKFHQSLPTGVQVETKHGFAETELVFSKVEEKNENQEDQEKKKDPVDPNVIDHD